MSRKTCVDVNDGTLHLHLIAQLVAPQSAISSSKKEEDKGEYEIESILAHQSLKSGAKTYHVNWECCTFEGYIWAPQATATSKETQSAY